MTEIPSKTSPTAIAKRKRFTHHQSRNFNSPVAAIATPAMPASLGKTARTIGTDGTDRVAGHAG